LFLLEALAAVEHIGDAVLWSHAGSPAAGSGEPESAPISGRKMVDLPEGMTSFIAHFIAPTARRNYKSLI
jgi:hypothetical protein